MESKNSTVVPFAGFQKPGTPQRIGPVQPRRCCELAALQVAPQSEVPRDQSASAQHRVLQSVQPCISVFQEAKHTQAAWRYDQGNAGDAGAAQAANFA